MFNKNIEALSLSNKKLAEKIQGIELEDAKKNIGVYKAESGDLIISYNNVNLHSVIDPIREANTNWNKTIKNALSKNDIQLVFGLGLGYLFKRAFVNCDSKVYLYEPFTDLLRFVFEYVDFSNELKEKRVYFTDSLEEITEKVNSEYIQGDKVDFLFLNSYSKVAVKELQEFAKNILEICQSQNIDSSQANYSKNTMLNFLNNLKNNQKLVSLTQLENSQSDISAIIVSQTEELESNVKELNNLQDKVLIISTAEALETLEKSKVSPDFVVKTNETDEKINLSEYYLISDFRTKLGDSKGVVLYTSQLDYCKEDLLSKIKEYPIAKTAEVIAYQTSKALGANQVFFLGLNPADKKLTRDLEEIDNNSYAVIKDLKELTGLNNKKTDMSTLVKTNSSKFGELIQDAVKTVNNSIKEFDEIEKNTQSLLETIDKMVEVIDKNEEINEELAKEFETKSQLLAENRQKAINNIVLSSYLQSDIWTYTQNYKTGILLSKSDINSNIKLEKDFSENIIKAINEIKNI